MNKNIIPLDPPGIILLEEFIEPSGLTQREVAAALHIPASRLSELIHGRLRINADLALRLGRLWSTSPELWLNLQSDYDLRIARNVKGNVIGKTIKPLKRSRLAKAA